MTIANNENFHEDGMPDITFNPTEEQRTDVMRYSGVGLIQSQIASLIDIDLKTLRKYFRKELDIGKAKTNAEIGQTFVEKVKSGDTASMIWWTKTQMGWKEKTDPAIIVNVPKSLDDFYADNETES